jgi:hypothetical protein
LGGAGKIGKGYILKIAIIDADLIFRKKHRFPNLVCMKLSAYYKDKNFFPQKNTVHLKWSFEELDSYDKVFVSKVFTDTILPKWLDEEFEKYRNDKNKETRKFQFGGTGFYFDKAPDLPYEIEHHFPDYDLYMPWIESKVVQEKDKKGQSFNEAKFRAQFKEYTDYSIGFLTRGCFRKCPFCVNQKYSHVFRHSPLEEFFDPSKKKICLLDDNFLGFIHEYDDKGKKISKRGDEPGWKELLEELQDKKIPFKFKQGLDERLLTHEICQLLFSSNYDGDFTFAFDKITDYDLIHQKLKIIRDVPKSKKASVRFYILVGFTYGEDRPLNINDIEDDFRRIELLMKYKCLPYIMRYQSKDDKPWQKSRYAKIYTEMARWCNQPNFFKKKSFEEYCRACEEYHHMHGGRAKHCSTWEAYTNFIKENPHMKKYCVLKFGDINKLKGEPEFAKRQREIREKLNKEIEK